MLLIKEFDPNLYSLKPMIGKLNFIKLITLEKLLSAYLMMHCFQKEYQNNLVLSVKH